MYVPATQRKKKHNFVINIYRIECNNLTETKTTSPSKYIFSVITSKPRKAFHKILHKYSQLA